MKSAGQGPAKCQEPGSGWSGCSLQKISEIMGISEGTSKSQLARARNILKKLVESQA
ncbi:MAG: sigma-70 family RNA polymerase sigma factor [Saprospiraceae bacterium]|nr:sigma-70 family RNA polymerase sigma factor [Saprospiraceae bacterium]